LVRVRGGT